MPIELTISGRVIVWFVYSTVPIVIVTNETVVFNGEKVLGVLVNCGGVHSDLSVRHGR